MSSEPGADGYLGAWRWLQAEHIPVASLRYRYDRLAAAELSGAGGGNVLITSLPQRLPYQLAEWQALERWINDGNTLVVMAALDDTPQWSLGASVDSVTTLRRLSHLDFTAAADTPSLRQLLGAQAIGFVPQGAHPLLHDIHALQAVTELPASQWQAHSGDQSLPLVIARASDSPQSVLWLKAQGQGQIIVCAFATPLPEQPRERSARPTTPGCCRISSPGRAATHGRVIFDGCALRGWWISDDAARFFADPRLHAGHAVVDCVAVAGVRARAAATAAHAPDCWHSVDETALIEASGRFLYPVAVDGRWMRAARIVQNFFNRFAPAARIARERRTAVGLAGRAGGHQRGAQRRELQALYARVCAGQRVNLTRLHNQLSKLEGQFT